MSEPEIIKMDGYKRTKSDARFNRRVREERGNHCEVCGSTGNNGQIEAHHVLDVRAFPAYRRTKENILVLCQRCHSQVTDFTGNLQPEVFEFYGSLPQTIRERIAVFLEQNEPKYTTLIQIFRRGEGYENALFWWRMEHGSLTPPEAYVKAFEKRASEKKQWLASPEGQEYQAKNQQVQKGTPRRKRRKISPKAARNYEALLSPYWKAKNKLPNAPLKGLFK